MRSPSKAGSGTVTREAMKIRAQACALALALGGAVMTQGCFRSSEARPGDECADARVAMVAHQIEARGIGDAAVLEAMRRVPRHLFVPPAWRSHAHEDGPLPIGHEQTISQPYIVAAMTELLGVGPGDVVLEVGTGSGYQAAVLAEIVRDVYTIEIVEPLAREADARLRELGYTNIHARAGDGYVGWPEAAPFDGILVTAGADHVPQPLVDQLKPGKRMVIPVGASLNNQSLKVLTKLHDGRVDEQDVMAVRFVPLTGEHSKWK
jgi:protein-L-isoaspartate(D-aspartate) O-methyltransferase